ncbi:DNA polymerase delta subunit 4 [Ophiocordyceps camponoti-floridani]|uniref:DNA polymerase delta subunit 4 n=1 Tax=Ophiocordyceps camponoti-floridani TaxID=2030778 RepID=A0A8H4VC43_9HYPO|nr:DNA polymerase delta subunit 4 [Ophiocordyceps camponoti-floridani]
MPPTRKHACGPRAARSNAGKAQSTLSFSGRVTKSTASDVRKNTIKPATVTKNLSPQRDPSPDKEAEETVAEEAKGEEEEEAAATAEETYDSQPTQSTEAPPREVTPAERKAQSISDAQISSYWKTLERQRKAPRIHQQDLDTYEKVLRYFDVSSQYGPCIGIGRMKRWLRADGLGLNPPIEVLAVLVKGEAEGGRDLETAKMDGILNAIVVGT